MIRNYKSLIEALADMLPFSLEPIIRVFGPEPPPPEASSADLLTDKQAAQLLGISRATLWRRNAMREIPAAVFLGRRTIRWSKRELEGWIEAGAPKRDQWEIIRNDGKREVVPARIKDSGPKRAS